MNLINKTTKCLNFHIATSKIRITTQKLPCSHVIYHMAGYYGGLKVVLEAKTILWAYYFHGIVYVIT